MPQIGEPILGELVKQRSLSGGINLATGTTWRWNQPQLPEGQGVVKKNQERGSKESRIKCYRPLLSDTFTFEYAANVLPPHQVSKFKRRIIENICRLFRSGSLKVSTPTKWYLHLYFEWNYIFLFIAKWHFGPPTSVQNVHRIKLKSYYSLCQDHRKECFHFIWR